MDPADSPGANKPKSDDPTEPINDVEVEKTLERLEIMTSKLMHEVGTPSAEIPPQAPVPAEAAPTNTASPNLPPGAEDAPDAAAPRPHIGGPATPQGRDGTAPPSAAASAVAPAASATAGPAGASPLAPAPPAKPKGTSSRNPAGVPAPADQATVPASAVEPKQASAPSAAKAAPPAPGPQTVTGQAPDPEVDQEISQAIRQLEAGKPPASGTPAVSPESKSPIPAASPTLAGVPARVGNAVDRILWPLVVVITVLDLPFRRIPGAVRQVLGYVAVGTALMAAAVWYYIFMLRNR